METTFGPTFSTVTTITKGEPDQEESVLSWDLGALPSGVVSWFLFLPMSQSPARQS